MARAHLYMFDGSLMEVRRLFTSPHSLCCAPSSFPPRVLPPLAQLNLWTLRCLLASISAVSLGPLPLELESCSRLVITTLSSGQDLELQAPQYQAVARLPQVSTSKLSQIVASPARPQYLGSTQHIKPQALASYCKISKRLASHPNCLCARPLLTPCPLPSILLDLPCAGTPVAVVCAVLHPPFDTSGFPSVFCYILNAYVSLFFPMWDWRCDYGPIVESIWLVAAVQQRI